MDEPPQPAPRKGGRKALPAVYVDSGKRPIIFCKRRMGLQSKAAQISTRTGCNVFLLIQQRPAGNVVNNYVYADPAWRTSVFSDATRMLLSAPHGLRDSESSPVYSPDTPYPEPFAHVPGSKIKLTTISDVEGRSASRDTYAMMTYGEPRRPTGGLGACNFKLDELEEGETTDFIMKAIDDALEEREAAAEAEEPAKRKRGPVAVEFIDDSKKRNQTYCKRRGGIMHKVFELSAITGCHSLLVLSSAGAAPHGSVEGGVIPSTYFVFASPAWRESPALPRLLNLLRVAQETEYWIPCFRADDPRACENPALRMAVTMGYPSEFAECLARCSATGGYMLPAQVNNFTLQEIKGTDDYGISFPWKASTLPIPESTLEERKFKREVKKAKRARLHPSEVDDIARESSLEEQPTPQELVGVGVADPCAADPPRETVALNLFTFPDCLAEYLATPGICASASEAELQDHPVVCSTAPVDYRPPALKDKTVGSRSVRDVTLLL